MKKHPAVKSIFVLCLAAILGSVLPSVPMAVAVAGAEYGSQSVGAGTGQGQPAAGTYAASIPLGGGLNFTALLTLHADGTATSQDVSDFGAASVAAGDGPHANTLAVGSWKHTTGQSYVATLVYFRSAVGGGGEVDSVGRLTIDGTFDQNFQTGSGGVIVENFPCVPATIGCPNPALLPGPAAPPFGTANLLRISAQ